MRKTLVLGAVAALSLTAAPSAIAKPLTTTAAKRATVARATKDARSSGTLLAVRVTACRRASSHRRVCTVTTRVRQGAGERTCRVRYRVAVRGHKARAKRVAGSSKCTIAAAPGTAQDPGAAAGTPPPAAPPGSANTPATPPQPGAAPPAEGEAHDPFNDCWAGCA